MTYSVHLVIIPPEGEHLTGLEDDVFQDVHFEVDIEQRSDGTLGIWCRGITPAGPAALPEALRLAQVGLSVALKNKYPVYAKRGGLLWSDVATAEINSIP